MVTERAREIVDVVHYRAPFFCNLQKPGALRQGPAIVLPVLAADQSLNATLTFEMKFASILRVLTLHAL